MVTGAVQEAAKDIEPGSNGFPPHRLRLVTVLDGASTAGQLRCRGAVFECHGIGPVSLKPRIAEAPILPNSAHWQIVSSVVGLPVLSGASAVGLPVLSGRRC